MMAYLMNEEVSFLQNKNEQVEGYENIKFISRYAKVFDPE
jgi:hypothetical protein